MRYAFPRIFALALCVLLFTFAMIYNPSKEELPMIAAQEKVLRVGVKTEQRESTVESDVEFAAESFVESAAEEQLPYIGTYLDADTVTQTEFTAPAIDLEGIYKKIVYPSSMRRKNIQASFFLRVYVKEDGSVLLEFPSDLEGAFRQAVEKAFQGVVATPAMYKGQKIAVTFTLPLAFKLN